MVPERTAGLCGVKGTRTREVSGTWRGGGVCHKGIGGGCHEGMGGWVCHKGMGGIRV